jgi:cyclophilin family peptidyl-prolyl cis-trans isomerase
VKHFLFLSLATGIVLSIVTVSGAAPPYTPSQSTPKVVIETVLGDITIELFPAKAPITVNNFLQYVNDGFYDGLIIHRVTKDASFKIVQGGGYEAGCVERTEGLRSPIINESYNGLSNLRATVAMARTSDPNSATSQFYINVTDNKTLNRSSTSAGYCVFGQVITGMDVVDQIQQLPLKPPAEAGGQTECPSYNNGWVTVYRQQVRVCVSPSGNDTTGLGSDDSPLKTIQKGIDVVNEPGHVALAPATYTGAGNVDLNLKGKAITLRAIEPRDINTVIKTVINCQGTSANKHRAIYFHDGEEANTVVAGLTIINGYQDRGGAIWCQSNPTIKNCIFANNSAGYYGGGVYCYNSDAVITNCTFSDNNAPLIGGGLYCGYNSHVTLSNSILWNNSSASGHEIAVSIASPPSSLIVSYCDVDGGLSEVFVNPACSIAWKPGNIDADPCFVDAANDDYHLQSSQRQWRDATSSWQAGGHTSPCIDSGNPGTALGNEPNVPTNVRIDMGSFGGTTKASIPPAGWGLRADIDNDGMVDETDFALFAGYWRTKGSDLPADLDFNKSVDFSDLKLFSDGWLKNTSQ